MKIIINADDFGVDYDRDIGIFFGVLFGYITSVSVIVTNKIDFFRKLLITIIRKKASVGLHINLTDKPLIKHNTNDLYIIDYNYQKEKYTFWKNALKDDILIDNINKEIESQFLKFIDEYAFVPDHIDGHNHCNIFNKKINKLFKSYSIKYGIHLRIPYEKITNSDLSLITNSSFFPNFDIRNQYSDFNFIINNYDYFIKNDILLYNNICKKFNYKDKICFIGSIYGYFRKPQVLYTQLLDKKENSIIQIMCHPGFYIPFLKHKTNFSNFDRFNELLSLKKVRKMILKTGNIEFTNYKKIPSNY